MHIGKLIFAGIGGLWEWGSWSGDVLGRSELDGWLWAVARKQEGKRGEREGRWGLTVRGSSVRSLLTC